MNWINNQNIDHLKGILEESWSIPLEGINEEKEKTKTSFEKIIPEIHNLIDYKGNII